MIVSLLAVVALAKNPCTDPGLREVQSASIANLYQDFEDTRGDRVAGDLLEEEARKADKRRVKEILKLDKKDRICTGEDKWHAAWILQASGDIDGLRRSYELAQESMEERVPRGAWLTAYAYDRMRTADGYPQAYGTQTRVDRHNRRCLIELDGSVDDKQRQAYGVPPLGSLYREVLDTNGFDKVAPTESKMREHNLFCNPVAQFDTKSARRAPGE